MVVRKNLDLACCSPGLYYNMSGFMNLIPKIYTYKIFSYFYEELTAVVSLSL